MFLYQNECLQNFLKSQYVFSYYRMCSRIRMSALKTFSKVSVQAHLPCTATAEATIENVYV